jgi:protein-S-isoprenylcysteine O-methyltransferase Ste14
VPKAASRPLARRSCRTLGPTNARMKSLEVKVPPPAVAVAIAVAMWAISRFAPLLQLPSALRLSAAAAVVLVGIGFSAAGVLAFRRARTTVNPTKPEQASSLVSSGVYRITRNPMYVGLLCVLVALAVFLSSAWALFGPVAFVLYIGRFQIAPEERALAKLFGSEYANYQAKVRRWL